MKKGQTDKENKKKRNLHEKHNTTMTKFWLELKKNGYSLLNLHFFASIIFVSPNFFLYPFVEMRRQL